MSDELRTLYQQAAATAEPCGDATQALTAAGRRRRNRIGGAAATVAAAAALIVGGVNFSLDSSPPASTHPQPPTRTGPTSNSTDTSAVVINGQSAPAAGVLYRTCHAGSCTVGIVHGDNQHVHLPILVAGALSTQGLDGVTLSTDGQWVGYPHGNGFTVANVANGGLSVDVPAGPAGSTWRPYYWTQGDLDLVLAQWTGGAPTAFAIVHVGYSNNPQLRVVVEPAPAGPRMLPASIGASYYNVLDLSPAVHATSGVQWPKVQTWRTRQLFTAHSTLGQPGLRQPSRGRDLTRCMRRNETLIGPDAVPMMYPVAPETSGDQAGAIIAFRRTGDGSVVPSGVIKGWCDSRYDLPQSTYTDSWTFLGPFTHTSSLMLHRTDDALPGELVVIGSGGQQTVIGHVQLPRAEVVAPGITGGQFG